MTLLEDRFIAGESTMRGTQPARHPTSSAEDFYLRGAPEPRRLIQIVPDAGDGSAHSRWLAELLESRVNSMLALERGWDGHKASPVTFEAVDSAVRLAFDLVKELVLPPQIFPLSDGGIQLEWHAGGDSIEIEIDGTGQAFVLVTDATGDSTLEDDLVLGSDAAAETRRAVHRLSTRVLGAR